MSHLLQPLNFALLLVSLVQLFGCTDANDHTTLNFVEGAVFREGKACTLLCVGSSHNILNFPQHYFEINEVRYTLAIDPSSLPNDYSVKRQVNYTTWTIQYNITKQTLNKLDNGTTYKCDIEGDVSDVLTLIYHKDSTSSSDQSNTSTVSTSSNTQSSTSAVFTLSNTQSSTSTVSTSSNTQSSTSAVFTSSNTQSSTVILSTSSSTQSSTVILSTSSSTQSSTFMQNPTETTTEIPIVERVESDENSNQSSEFVFVIVGSITGIVGYLLTVILIGVVMHLAIKARRAHKRQQTPSPPVPPPNGLPMQSPGNVLMYSNPLYTTIRHPNEPAPPYFKDETEIIIQKDYRYQDLPERKSQEDESLYDYILP